MRIADSGLSRPFAAVWWFGFIFILFNAFPASNSLIPFIFLLLACLVQATLFSLPLVPLILLANRFPPQSKYRKTLVYFLFFSSLSVIIFLVANYKLYSLYGFFTNFFVLNIVSTPGGIEAMGITRSTWGSLIMASVLLALVFVLILRFIKLEILLPGLRKRTFAAVMLVCLFSQSIMYAYADYESDMGVLDVADRVVWYIPVTAKSMFESIGITRKDKPYDEMQAGKGKLNYVPADHLDHSENTTDALNIVWLVAESWRADTLTQEIMPNTYEFAMENQWFQNHYSGGNGTRMGMFTQFYGIYGNYWFDMLRAQQPPLLIELLQARGYEAKAFTSSAFTYPEFDKTVFSQFDDSQLQEYNEGEGWQRDQKNTTDLIKFIDSADKPFFTFMFFESAHANYYFPDEDIIRPDYLEDFNYLTVDIEEEIDSIKNRYVNSVHHLDRQLARVYEALDRRGLLENTIVIVTGDHGEEFMENGRWGHNSTFSQQQIRVPLVLHVPDRQSKQFAPMTSHIDLPATVLSLIDFDLEPDVYSHGENLFSSDYGRKYAVVSDWHGNTLVTPDVKVIFSVKGASYYSNLTDINDNRFGPDDPVPLYNKELGEYTLSLNRFYN